jgi:hypothetical protein
VRADSGSGLWGMLRSFQMNATFFPNVPTVNEVTVLLILAAQAFVRMVQCAHDTRPFVETAFFPPLFLPHTTPRSHPPKKRTRRLAAVCVLNGAKAPLFLAGVWVLNEVKVLLFLAAEARVRLVQPCRDAACSAGRGEKRTGNIWSGVRQCWELEEPKGREPRRHARLCC